MTKIRKATFTPAVDFEGYPFGNKVQFRKGERSMPVAESYAELMRDKGLVEPGTQITPVAEKDEK